MSERGLSERLERFLQGVEADREAGHTLEAMHVALGHVADGLSKHEAECSKRWADNDAQHASAHRRLVALEAHPPPTVPPMRSRETSSHDLAEFAERVKRSAIEGLQSPDTTPDARVREVVVEEQAARDERRELERLRTAEAEAKALLKEQARVRASAVRSVVVGVLSGAGVAGVIELGRLALDVLRHAG